MIFIPIRLVYTHMSDCGPDLAHLSFDNYVDIQYGGGGI